MTTIQTEDSCQHVRCYFNNGDFERLALGATQADSIREHFGDKIITTLSEQDIRKHLLQKQVNPDDVLQIKGLDTSLPNLVLLAYTALRVLPVWDQKNDADDNGAGGPSSVSEVATEGKQLSLKKWKYVSHVSN